MKWGETLELEDHLKDAGLHQRSRELLEVQRRKSLGFTVSLCCHVGTDRRRKARYLLIYASSLMFLNFFNKKFIVV